MSTPLTTLDRDHTGASPASPPISSVDSHPDRKTSEEEMHPTPERKVDPTAFVAANTGRDNIGGFVTQGDPAQKIGALAAIATKYKVAALLCVIFLSMGSNFCGSSLGPLKSSIRAEVGISNSRYGAISSASSIVNAVLPILSGILIDYYGPSSASLLCSVVILVGSIVRAVGGQRASFGTILAGEIVMGFGSTSIETAQSKLYTHWFRGTKEGNTSLTIMGFVFGLDIAMGRVFNLMGGQTAIPIADQTGVWYWSFWLGAIMCAITLGINLAYLCIERALPAAARVPTGRQLAHEREERNVHEGYNRDGSERTGRGDDGIVAFVRSRLAFLSISVWTIPAAFWLVVISQLLQAGAVGAYNSNSADAIEMTRNTTRFTAGYTSSLSQILPIVLTPLLGLAFDFFGRRMYVVATVAALWTLVFSLLAYSSVNPLLPVLLGSVALSANALPFIASIPLLVTSQASIGTAFGIWKAFNSSGSTVVDIAVGAIQDQTPNGGYSRVFAFLIALKAIDIFFGCAYHYIDRRYFGSVLFMSEKKRIDREREEEEESNSDDEPSEEKGHQEQQRRRRRRSLMVQKRSWTIAGLTVACALIITAYVLFILYSYMA